ncbi:MAG: biopolymer transporter ExbD [Chlamydiales bacterium]
MKQRRSPILEEAPINLTPLIDVVFVILIMFIVVAPLVEIDRLELAKGKGLKEPFQQDKNLTIRVFSDNTITFNHQQVTLEQLQNLLIHAHTKSPLTYPQLFHDRQAYFGTYQSVKNAVEKAGFTQLDVLLNPQ